MKRVEDKIRVFISYNHNDSIVVDKIEESLLKNNYKVERDKYFFDVGDKMPEKINKIISESDVVIAVISNNSINSGWVKSELNVALTLCNQNQSIIMPFIIDDTKPPVEVLSIFYADCKISFDEGMNKIIRSLNNKFPNNPSSIINDWKKEFYKSRKGKIQLLVEEVFKSEINNDSQSINDWLEINYHYIRLENLEIGYEYYNSNRDGYFEELIENVYIDRFLIIIDNDTFEKESISNIVSSNSQRRIICKNIETLFDDKSFIPTVLLNISQLQNFTEIESLLIKAKELLKCESFFED